MKTIIAIAIALAAFQADAAIHRSAKARTEFARQVACPETGMHKLPCKGYIIDHIKALACGGRDAPDNMQWQTVAEAKAKDKWERNECKTRAAQ